MAASDDLTRVLGGSKAARPLRPGHAQALKAKACERYRLARGEHDPTLPAAPSRR